MSEKFTFEDIPQSRQSASSQFARMSRRLAELKEQTKVETRVIQLSKLNHQIAMLTRRQQELTNKMPGQRRKGQG